MSACSDSVKLVPEVCLDCLDPKTESSSTSPPQVNASYFPTDMCLVAKHLTLEFKVYKRR